MPYTLTPEMGNSGGGTSFNISVQDRGYHYPYGMDLRPGSPLHSKIVDRVNNMASDSFNVMSQRHETWRKTDQTLKVYIPLSTYEKAIVKKDPNKPVSIVVPYSYATMETVLAYCTKAFLSDTVFSYEGNGPEDTVPAKLLELCVNQQVHRFKSSLDIHTAFRDNWAYGMGVSTLNWAQKWGKKPVIQESTSYSMYGGSPIVTKQKVNQDALLFEGNEIISIDPYRFLPDPNVSVHNVRNGEFVGWIEFMSLYKMLGDEMSDQTYFNVKYLQDAGYKEVTSKYTADNSGRLITRDSARTPMSTRYNTLIHMYVTLIPKEWGITPSMSGNQSGEYPEIWLFSLANDNLVVRATPLGLNHGMYPVAVCATEFDGYSCAPLSRMELISGLQTCLNWMFNSHIANVRKAINDMLVVDPSLINMEDLKDPEPGKLIRLRRSAWGKGVKDAVSQLTVNDITARNMVDAVSIMDVMQKASAATDATMGIMRSGGERRSATEFSGTMQMAVSRLEHIARITSLQYLQDLAFFHASHTQQLMSEATFVKAVGDWPMVLAQEFGRMGFNIGRPMQVSPFDIIADYDIIFKDGSIATADSLTNDFWKTMFQTIATNPYMLQAFDVVRIFKHMARLNGAKNVSDFIVNQGGDMNAATYPDEAVQSQVQAGNLVTPEELLQISGNMGQAGGMSDLGGMEGLYSE